MNNKNIYKVGIYLRLSDEDQNKTNKEEDSESIKNQRHLLLEEIKRRPNFILKDEYCDENLSGAGTYRPEFERLIKDCELGKLDIVLCKSQSRFSRDMEIIEKYIHNKFIEWNVRFISLADNADTANRGNKKSRQINGLVNEWYLEDVSNNIRSAFNAKMKQGEFISPFAPYGYEIAPYNNNKLIIDPIASITVQEIFNLYQKGLGLTAIAKYLNENHIPSPSFYKHQKGIKLNITSTKPRDQIKWSPNTIKTILTNEIYIGNLIQGKRTTISYKNHKIKNKNKNEWIKRENTHQPIITKETFYKVQKSLKERTKPQKKNHKVHIFSGKIFCLECQNYMRKKNSQDHEYLICTNNQNCINKKSIRYDTLEKLILTRINYLIKKYYNQSLFISPKTTTKLDILTYKKNTLEKQLNQNKEYLKNIYEDKIKGIITPAQFQTLSNDYQKNETIYNNQLKSIITSIKNYNQEEKLKHNHPQNFNNEKKFNHLNRIIIEEFIDKIYISNLDNKTRTIKIKWNF